jgi:hypothetical protein
MSVTCPRCHESNVRRSHRRPHDLLPRFFGMVALRCNLCEHRFFRFRRTLPRLQHAERPRESAPAHLPASR